MSVWGVLWRISASQKGKTGETFDSCALQVQRSCQVLHEPKVKCFTGPVPVNGYRLPELQTGLVVMGPQSYVSARMKSELPRGHIYSLPKQKEKWKDWTFKLPNLFLKGVICMVNSLGSIYYQSAPLSFTHPLLSISSPTFSFTFSIPTLLSRGVSTLTAVSSICLNGPCCPCWGVESNPSLEDPEIRPLSANPTQYQGAPRSSSSLWCEGEMDRALWSSGRAPEQDSIHCTIQIKQASKGKRKPLLMYCLVLF